jgi:hypothetical protein
MSSLRERAAADAKKILENRNGAGTPFVLVSKTNEEFQIVGSYGDIGYLLDTATGQAIQGRTIEAAYSMESLSAQTPLTPERGWRFKVLGLSGQPVELFVVKYEPDRTMGIGRLKLAVNLNESID